MTAYLLTIFILSFTSALGVAVHHFVARGRTNTDLSLRKTILLAVLLFLSLASYAVHAISMSI